MNNRKKPYVTAIILAAGSGSRMGLNTTKQRLMLCGESILRRTVRAFNDSPDIDAIVVVGRADEKAWITDEVATELKKIHSVISGGKTRAESAKAGFKAIPNQTDFVAIHDGARCLITDESIHNVVTAAYEYGAATAGTAVTDTTKTIENNLIVGTLKRESLFAAHTPQVFSVDIYKKALDTDLALVTDDNMLVENVGGKIRCVDTGRQNIKITTTEDLEYAEYIIKRRGDMQEMRIGHGYDVHRFDVGRKLVIGGVNIPHDKGLVGHSDADVLIHAIMDALLGACGLGDIGRHFPDSSSEYKDISSLVLLERINEIIISHRYTIVNIDATVVLQKPKIAPYIEQMIHNISSILGIEQGRINIKATTEEQLGFTGSGEGASAHAVALVKK